MSLTKFLESVRARLDAATMGPWQSIDIDSPITHVVSDYTFKDGHHSANWICECNMEQEEKMEGDELAANEANSTLIASAPTDLDKLLRIVEVQRKALEKINFDRGTTSQTTNAANYHFASIGLVESDKIAGEK